VPLSVHGVVEYVEGVLTILAPFLFNYNENDGATVVSILLGGAILVLAVQTQSPTGLVRNLPLASHIVLDYVPFPFIFGFSDESSALAYFLVLGIAHLLMTVTTRFGQREAGP
jgi:hypothetical protein